MRYDLRRVDCRLLGEKGRFEKRRETVNDCVGPFQNLWRGKVNGRVRVSTSASFGLALHKKPRAP